MTRATDKRPVRRVVQTAYDGELVVTVYERHVTVRPTRTRTNGPAEVQMSWGQLYQHLLIARAEAKVREKRALARARKGARRTR